MVLNRIVGAYLSDAINAGTSSWDITIQKILLVVLMQSTDCRVGEITKSSKYTGSEFLAWKHIILALDGPPTMESVRCQIDIVFLKGHKYVLYLAWFVDTILISY